MIRSKDDEELDGATLMYELKKWVIKPVLNEVVCRLPNKEELTEKVREIMYKEALTNYEFRDLYIISEYNVNQEWDENPIIDF